METAVDLDSFLSPRPAAPDVPDGPDFAAWRLRVLSLDEFAALGTGDERLSAAQLTYLAWLDLLAPTSHNTVPQRLQLDAPKGALILWIDREQVLRESDPTGRQATVGLGCGIANVVLAARSYGWDAHDEVLAVPPEQLGPRVADEPRHTRVAVIDFRPSGKRLAGAWVPAMLTRQDGARRVRTSA